MRQTQYAMQLKFGRMITKADRDLMSDNCTNLVDREICCDIF